MRLPLSILIAAALLVAGAAHAFADGTGIDSSGCSPCHGGATGSLVVTVAGPATLGPGTTGDYFVSIPPTLVGAGIAAEVMGGGSIDSPDPNTQLLGGTILTHTQRNDGVFGYNVEVTAPGAPGMITLEAALLAYDDANGAGGDEWNTALMDIMVEVPEPSHALLFLAGLLPLAGGAALHRRRVA